MISFLAFFPTPALPPAIICPSVSEIKQHTFNQWLPLYQEGEELASTKDTLQFIEEVTAFHSARWSSAYLENGHCFYEGGLMTQKIILAQDAWQPGNEGYWQWLKPKSLAECIHSSPKACPFLQ
ncbi:MAG: hypothetical protein WC785_09355 [Tatlockia sp.]|jgi:hypothetical protein